MSETSNNKPISLSFDEAIKLIPDREEIHTFRNPGGMLLGADWDRAKLLDAMRKSPAIQVSGETAQRMGHGLVIEDDGLLFIEAANYDQTEAEK